MPPDEFCARCDNSAYTNAAAAAALAGPARMSRLFRRDVTVSQKAWEDLSSQIWMPFDATEKVMLEYEGYDSGRTIKQADTILLSYPLMYTQSKEDKTRMIEKYAAVTSLNGPAMTWAMFCICAMEVDVS
ncbi:unnamed protein product [Mesocestoides corti]|uniref:Uncharacterized protein n=1 Tax=Mesocestoides corti TaxID=53468 RepID=A0A0R3UDI3_MESCO|nr:unnamed protein product [Mesocestoides corti]